MRLFAAGGALLLLSALPLVLGAARGRAVEREALKLSHRDRLYDVTTTSTGVFVVGHPGLVLHAKDGTSFTNLNVGQTDEALFSVAFNSKGRGAIVGRSGFTLVSDDQGAHWQKSIVQLDDEKPSLFAVSVLEDGAIVAVGEFGVIVRSTDLGKTWTRSSYSPDPPTAEAPAAVPEGCVTEGEGANENADMMGEARLTDVAFRDAYYGFAVGEFGLILATEDGGVTFKRVTSCTDRTLHAVSVVDSQRAIAVGAEGTVVESHGGGALWAPMSSGSIEHLFGVATTRDRTLILGAAGTALLREGEGASPFRAIDTGVHSWLVSAALDAQGRGYIVGGRAFLRRTEDGGKTQRRISGE